MTEDKISMPDQMRRYIFKLYPTADQAEAAHQQRKMSAELWNAMLERWETIEQRTHQRQTWHDRDGNRHRGITRHIEVEDDAPGAADILSAEIAELRAACPEWAALSVWTPHEVRRQLKLAFQAFWRRLREGDPRPGYPRYKRVASGDSIPHRHNLPPGKKSGSGSGCLLRRVKGLSWQLSVKGIEGPIHARGALPESAHDFSAATILWRDNRWWFSVCVNTEPKRRHGKTPARIEFDLLDGFARMNGRAEYLPEMAAAALLQERADELRSDADTRWPRGKRLSDDDKLALAEARAEIARLVAKASRKRKDALHVWTARLVARSSEITIIAPKLREQTRSGRGDEKHWGAAVETKAALNRNVLGQAPGMAIQMLRYKAEEAGIQCTVITDDAPKLAVGGELVTAGKQLRRARREIRRAA